MNKGDFRILITRDKENRILTVEDNGIGMTKEELEQNLGTIAHSGSLDFKKDNKDENIDIIGQFGVGFYSAFMVADKLTVISKAYGSDEAWQWESSGVDGYEMTPAQKDTVGTQIILHIKPDTDTEKYDNFLDEYGIVAIVKKYSDYVRYPIQMEREKSRQKPEPDPKPDDYKPEWETYTELETLNSMVPIWKKQKSEVTDEEYANFYKDKFSDYADPARVIVSRTEGTANYNALLFVPSHRPYDFYTKDYEKGLALYASGVLIMEKCADLLPDYFSFVKGIVDSQDLSLNISREMLQKDNQLKLIHNCLLYTSGLQLGVALPLGLVILGLGVRFRLLALVLALHLDGVAHIVAVLLDDGHDAVLVEEVVVVVGLRVGLDVEDDVGTGSLLLSRLKLIAVSTAGLPLPGLVGAVSLGDDRHFVSHHEGRVEADTELTDDVDVLVLVVLLEVEGAGVGDGAEVLLQLFSGHADAVIGDGQGAAVLVAGEQDAEIAFVHADRSVGQALIIQLVDGVRSVGDQLAQENFLVGVDGVDHHVHQLFALGLKFFFRHNTKPLFIRF